MDLKPLSRAFLREGEARRAFALVALLHLFALITLTASPSLHEWVHHDSDSCDHECAVTVFVGGQVDLASVDITVGVPVARTFLSFVLEPMPECLGSFFLDCGRLEHAPPSHS
jgi:hypothetical protein